jgi:hypothetical protein
MIPVVSVLHLPLTVVISKTNSVLNETTINTLLTAQDR